MSSRTRAVSKDPHNVRVRYREDLRLAIAQHFNRDELHDLCFDFGFDYEDFGGPGKVGLVRELILCVGRHNRLSDLITYCQQHRPKVKWDKFVEVARDHPDWLFQDDETMSYRSESLGKGLNAVVHLLRYPIIRTAITTFQADFEMTNAKIRVIGYFKQLHDDLQEMETTYNLLANDRERLPEDELAWDDLAINELLLQDTIDKLLEVTEEPPDEVSIGSWFSLLEKGKASLQAALMVQDIDRLDVALGYLYRVLERGLTRVNGRLVDASDDLPLDRLVAALQTVLAEATPKVETKSDIIDQFAAGVAALNDLSNHLDRLVSDHNQWQAFDDELRRVEASLNTGVFELQLTWPDIQEMSQKLYGQKEESWASILRQLENKLNDKLALRKPGRTAITIFQRYRTQASRQFRQIDDDLLEIVQELEKIGQPVNTLLGALQ